MAQPEYDKVEKPLIEQLIAMGWQHLQGAPPGEPVTSPAPSGRSSFSEAVYADRFRTAVARINPGPDGKPWLNDTQLDHLFASLLGTGVGRGVAGNLSVTETLRKGVNARSLPGWTKGKPEHVRLVDWEGEFAPLGDAGTGNDLLAVSQFKVVRSGAPGAIPDIVLFVNGLPWVVIECKAPLASPGGKRFAIDWAVEDVIGYAGAEAKAPVAEFVRFAQVLVATDRDHAEVGTVTADAEDFAPWRTVCPARPEQVRTEAAVPDSRADLHAQERLVGGVLRPAHLLTLVRDFTTEAGRGPRTVKVIGRYQQFRAVHRIAKRLRDRREMVAAGHEVDQRGGVTWHTQGSGKSLTMAFLVRHLRSDADLKGHKVVVVTDRTDLERQIRASMAAADEKIYRARTVKYARSHLGLDLPDVVLVMLQKARRDDDDTYDGKEEVLARTPGEKDLVHNRVVNASSDIVVLIDEAHRGQSAWQNARLRAMLPNATMIGFTGTPILSGARKTTEEIFGSLADTYTLRDGEIDGAVMPVRYTAQQVSLELVEKAALDAGFDQKVPADPEKRAKVLRKFGRRKQVLESPSVIAKKAEHMVWDWATRAMPDGFGAQVVAVSRKAAVAYREALEKALRRLVAELDALGSDAHDPAPASDRQADLLRLLPHRDVLASVHAAVVISSPKSEKGKDPAEWDVWTRKKHHEEHISRFRRGVPVPDPFAAVDDPSWAAQTHAGPDTGDAELPGSVNDPWHGAGSGAPAGDTVRPEAEVSEPPLGFLVVTSMLLTGFDAPVEQVMYLDRSLFGAGLLQAIARTNRPYRKKEWGLVVDYVGVGPELARSMAEYEDAHLKQVLGYQDVSFDHLDPDSKAAQPTEGRMWLQVDAAADALLADLRKRLGDFLTAHGVRALGDESQREDLLAVLRDPLMRGEFDELARDFFNALNAVLPRPTALVYEAFARLLSEVQYLARERYLDGREQFSPRRYGAKVRALIAEHLRAPAIAERIPPVQLGAPDFMARVNANPDPRARVSYLTSRIRTQITAHLEGYRSRYEQFSQRLEAVIRQMDADFDEAAAALALAQLAEEIIAFEEGAAQGAGEALQRWTERPVYAVLSGELASAGASAVPDGIDLYQAARDVTWKIATLVSSPNFATLADAQHRVRKELRIHLEEKLHVDWDETGTIAGALVELAIHRREDFLRYEQ
ncbi:type I restriction endonuclease [Streptomyces sp. NPDC048606]|uniref:type I restriction endonuclease subunit R n=1 Tax=Streptomyces sp. NPDC048606 TaxID=3154726 RepID=UPI003425D5AE